MQQLLDIKDNRATLCVARHPNIPSTVLEQLAREPEWKVRVVVAKNHNTPVVTLEQLVEDEQKFVREAAIANLCQHSCNTSIPSSILEQFEAVQNSQTSQATLKELATSQWVLIHEGVARHPNTSIDVLRQLATDDDRAILVSVAQNSNTPGSLLEQLAAWDGAVRLAVAENRNTPISLLKELAHKRSRNQLVREAAFRNLTSQQPKLLTMFLAGLIESNQPSFTRLLVLLHPQAPNSALTKNSRSSSWLERYAITQNPKTPRHIRQRLALDGNRVVRAAASNFGRTRVE